MRNSTLLFGATTIILWLLVATIHADDQARHYDARTLRAARVPIAFVENVTASSQVLFAQSESPSDLIIPQDAIPQIRPRVDPPQSPDTRSRVRSTINDAETPDPNALVPNDVRRDALPRRPGLSEETAIARFRRARTRASFARRRRPIAVLGDSFVDVGQITLQFSELDNSKWPAAPSAASASTDIPLGAAATRTKTVENTSVVPTDRAFVTYQHFRNVGEADISSTLSGDIRRTLNLDRMTIGIEKTYFDQQWSIDLRLPVTSQFDVSTTSFEMTSGRLGNASLILKHLAYETDAMSLGLGVGIDTPTGSDGHVLLPTSALLISNDAFHALPYLGLIVTPHDNFAVQAFAQLDLPLNGNQIEASSSSGAVSTARFDEQELLFLSISAAHWHYHHPDATYLRGVAAIMELHYTTSLDDADQVMVAAQGDTYSISNPANHISYLNLTAGLQTQIGMTDIRTAAVIPLLDGVNQPFDAEFLLQINRRF